MQDHHDVVVAGAGHNTLVAAAYLAAAGLKVLVLERNAWIGGGVVTREMTLPGFRHDLHSTGHMLIQSNPLILHDELGLQARFGLKYIRPDISFATVFEDGTRILTYHDLDKTCESIALISARDAEAYRRHVESSRQVVPMIVAGLFKPPVPFGNFMSILEQSRQGREMIGMMNMSAFDIISTTFENDKVRNHFLKISSEAMSGPEEKGTGLVFNMLVGFMHSYHGGFPQGGSAELCNALVRCIEHHGGSVRVNAPVSEVIMESGEAKGVRLDDGETIYARKAVIGSFHPHLLGQYVQGLDPYIVDQARKTHHGGYSAINTHYALNEAPAYHALSDLQQQPMMVECIPMNFEHFRREFDELRYGRFPEHGSLVCATHTNFDPTRAPPGKHSHFMYAFMPYDLAEGGPGRWDEVKEEVADRLLGYFRKFTSNMGSDNILARYTESPLDFERSSASFQRGDISGIGRYLYQFLGRRPTPELAQYAVPGADRLYLSGPFMHPGGGVIGGGRATAVKILADLDIDFETAIS